MAKAELVASGAPRRAAVVRHLAFEDLGSFAPVLADRGYSVQVLDAGVDALEEALGAADLAVILGGPIGVYETDSYPFLHAELSALQTRLKHGLPTLGICLGAQLIASALGARVFPGNGKEIGWAQVRLTEAGQRSPLAAIEGRPVLHWHGDTFELPEAAVGLASTDRYVNQAFAIGSNVLGLQFHLESDPRRFEQWLIGHAGELAAAGISVNQLRAEGTRAGVELGAAGSQVLRDWLDQIT
jgi:GMP synthase (glutamine-hydrolysing)